MKCVLSVWHTPSGSKERSFGLSIDISQLKPQITFTIIAEDVKNGEGQRIQYVPGLRNREPAQRDSAPRLDQLGFDWCIGCSRVALNFFGGARLSFAQRSHKSFLGYFVADVPLCIYQRPYKPEHTITSSQRTSHAD